MSYHYTFYITILIRYTLDNIYVTNKQYTMFKQLNKSQIQLNNITYSLITNINNYTNYIKYNNNYYSHL